LFRFNYHLIISHKSGHVNEGGDGVTVAKLAVNESPDLN